MTKFELAESNLHEIYDLIGSEDGYNIVKVLLQEENGIRTMNLIKKSNVPEHRFYCLMTKLMEYKIVERQVKNDGYRSVEYSLSLATDTLNLSEPLLKAIKEAVFQSNKK